MTYDPGPRLHFRRMPEHSLIYASDMKHTSGATSTLTRTRVALMTLLTLALAALAATFPTEASAAGPCKVTGYTIHAQLQMSTRDISKSEVEASVRVNCSRGRWQPTQKTWIYQGSSFQSPKRPAVVMNAQGVVVTAWRPTGSGGGGAGSWGIPVAPELL